MKQIQPNLINEFFYCSNRVILKDLNKSDNKYIQIGTILDQENLKKIKLGNFEIDEVDFKNKLIIERKKRITNFEGYKFQLLYYLYLTKNIYKNFTGLLIGIEDKKIYKVNLTKTNELELLKIIEKINQIIEEDKFDYNLINEQKCKNCSMYDFCNI